MSSLYQGGEFKPMLPVETAEDRKNLKAMFRHEGEVSVFSGSEIAGNEGTLVQIHKKQRVPKVPLTRHVDLDWLYRMLLTSPHTLPWFFNPHMPQQGYKDQPWRHLMPYEIKFDCLWLINNFPKLTTYTLGITDKKLVNLPGICCMLYLKEAEGAQEVMNRLLCHIDEGLIHPSSRCLLRYPDGATRFWGKGTQRVLDHVKYNEITNPESDVASIAIHKALEVLSKKGEPRTSELRRTLERLFRQVKYRHALWSKGTTSMKQVLNHKVAADAEADAASLSASICGTSEVMKVDSHKLSLTPEAMRVASQHLGVEPGEQSRQESPAAGSSAGRHPTSMSAGRPTTNLTRHFCCSPTPTLASHRASLP